MNLPMPENVTVRPLRRALPLAIVVAVLWSLAVPSGAQTSTTVAPSPTTTVPPPPPPTTTPPPVPSGPAVPDPAAEPAPPGEEVPPEERAPEPPMPDPSPTVRVLLDRLAVIDAERARDGRAADLAAAEAARAGADQAERDARRRADDERAKLEQGQRRLGALASVAYIHPNSDGRMVAAVTGEFTLADREADTLRVAISHYNEVVASARRAVADADGRVEAAHEAVGEAAARVADATAALAGAEQAVVDARSEVGTHERDRDRARADEARRLAADPAASVLKPGAWQLTIKGDSVFTAEELTRWFAVAGGESLATVPMDELARAFIDEGHDEGLRGDMAFAQAMLETGGFANDDTVHHNNFAGVGHCDSCETGFTFDSAQLGVRGQIQLLKSYVDDHPTYVHELVDQRLQGPAGCCQTWNALSSVWATGPNYGPKILGIYVTMLQWLVDDRSGMHDPAASAGTLAGL